MSLSYTRPEWATTVDAQEKIKKRRYIEGPYTDESSDHSKELLYEVYNERYLKDEHHKGGYCVTTRYSLRSLLTAPSMGLKEPKMHNADEKEPIFELVDHAFADGSNVTYIACSYITDPSGGAPFLFKTNKYYSNGELRVDGRNHTDNTLMSSAVAAGHLLQKEMPRKIDFDSTAQAFLSQFGSTGPQRFDRPQFIPPRIK